MLSNKSTEIMDDNNAGDEELMNRLTTLNIRENNTCTSSSTFRNSLDSVVSDCPAITPKSLSPATYDPSAYQKPLRKHGINCFNTRCEYSHLSGWHPCQEGSSCKNFYCKASHPFNRSKPCQYGLRCKKIRYEFLHPSVQIGGCPAGDQCRTWQCKTRHPSTRPKHCSFGEQCYNAACPCVCIRPIDNYVQIALNALHSHVHSIVLRVEWLIVTRVINVAISTVLIYILPTGTHAKQTTNVQLSHVLTRFILLIEF